MEKSAFQANVIRAEANQIYYKCISDVVESHNICQGDNSYLIGFTTKGDLQCEVIVDWQRARCPRPTLMVSYDTITVGGL